MNLAGGPVQEEKARQGGPVQNISDVGGTHMRLSLCQQFSASQDTDSISLGVNNVVLGHTQWHYSVDLEREIDTLHFHISKVSTRP